MNRLELTERLFEEVPEEQRCPHIRKDEAGAYCGKDLKDQSVVSFARRYACDTASLQLYCLDRDRCDKCIFYKGEKFS